MSNVAILWDMENVNPGSDSLFLEGLTDYAEAKGRVVAARAYGNWNHTSLSKLAPSLTRRYFYLVHIPKGQKNSSDMVLVSDALEILRVSDHIDTFILVTGDSDFRFLVLSLRRAGKIVHIVCNTKNASEDLLALADSYVDYRELMPGGSDEESGVKPAFSSGDKAPPEKIPAPTMSQEDWFQILAEAADLMLKKKTQPGIGSLKIRMKMLNPNFDEKRLHFSHWSEFVTAAVKAGFVTIEGKGSEALVYPVTSVLQKAGTQQKAFLTLLEVLKELDKGNKSIYHSYRSVNSKLIEKKIYFNDLGFNQFKEFIQAAESRGLVESKVEGLKHSVKRL
ncbi:MAG TPA: NYN domain-containing protein [Syntrophorhabdus sp.]|nr:NYN domain-containing protein [Syntrophorhabdus sp.]HPB37558.1 NYN domain-containing protein [Syntrophorhabdus sp.]